MRLLRARRTDEDNAGINTELYTEIKQIKEAAVVKHVHIVNLVYSLKRLVVELLAESAANYLLKNIRIAAVGLKIGLNRLYCTLRQKCGVDAFGIKYLSESLNNIFGRNKEI